MFVSLPNPEDLLCIKELVESGKLTPTIDRRYPLAEVPDAMRFAGAGTAQGKIVITF